MIPTLFRVLGPEHAAPVRRTVALMGAAATAEGLAYALLLPILRALFSDRPASVWPWLLGFLVAVMAYGGIRYLGDLAGFRVGTILIRSMYHRLGDHLARLPIGWFGSGRTGSVATLASQGVLHTMSALAHLLAPLVFAVVTPGTILLVTTAVDWRLGLALAATAPIVAVTYFWAGRAMRTADGQRSANEYRAAERVVEFLRAQRVLRVGGRAEQGGDQLDQSLREVHRATRRTVWAVVPGTVGFSLAVQAALTSMLVLGAYLALGGGIGVPDVLAVLVMTVRCADPLSSLAQLAGQVRAIRTELDRLDTVLRAEPLPEPRHPVRPEHYDLDFDAVTFRRGERTVIDSMSLHVPHGTRLALVGPSGAGKSTVLQLLARFHDVDCGAVRVGGVDVREMSTADLLARLSVVFQEVYLFAGSIEANIRLGRAGATAADVRAAATAAQLDDVIEQLPGGWATEVGEGGAMLSGGERQRVSIARALLKDAPIVLLDEVTAALDPDNEVAVHAALERLLADRTVVMVTHRLHTIERADQIAFVTDGRIVEQGTRDELLRRNGRFSAFWKTQHQHSGN